MTFQHSFYCGTEACILPQTILESSTRSQEVRAWHRLMPAEYHLPTRCFLRGLQEWKSVGAKSRLQGVEVNEQHPSYGTLTVMVHLAMWHAIHHGVLYTHLTGTRSETWQCEASCSCLGYRHFTSTSYTQEHHPWCYGRSWIHGGLTCTVRNTRAT